MAAQQPETIRLFMMPLTMGMAGSLSTFCRLVSRLDPGRAEKPSWSWAWERVALIIRM